MCFAQAPSAALLSTASCIYILVCLVESSEHCETKAYRPVKRTHRRTWSYECLGSKDIHFSPCCPREAAPVCRGAYQERKTEAPTQLRREGREQSLLFVG